MLFDSTTLEAALFCAARVSGLLPVMLVFYRDKPTNLFELNARCSYVIVTWFAQLGGVWQQQEVRSLCGPSTAFS